MPIYVYETVSARKKRQPDRFEIRQSIFDAPLKRHPETGKPIRRIITGGLGYFKTRAGSTTANDHGDCCPSCHD